MSDAPHDLGPCAGGRPSSTGRPPTGAPASAAVGGCRFSTASAEAAEQYELAIQRLDAEDVGGARGALARAMRLDGTWIIPALAVAILEDEPGWPSGGSIRATRWERHHQDILTAARAGQFDRARALLAEHERRWGRDPVAAMAVQRARSDDIAIPGSEYL